MQITVKSMTERDSDEKIVNILNCYNVVNSRMDFWWNAVASTRCDIWRMKQSSLISPKLHSQKHEVNVARRNNNNWIPRTALSRDKS